MHWEVTTVAIVLFSLLLVVNAQSILLLLWLCLEDFLVILCCMTQLKSIRDIQKNGTAAVVRLGKQKLASGHPFMINSRKLPKGQCYLEYPNASILSALKLSPVHT